MTLAFLLACENGEWKILESGLPYQIRQSYKSLLVDSEEHDYTEILYTSQRGDVKFKRWRKRISEGASDTTTAMKALALTFEENLDYGDSDGGEYTGDDEAQDEQPILALKRTRRKR